MNLFNEEIFLPNNCVCKLELIGHEVLVMTISDGYEFDVEDARYIVDYVSVIGKGKKFKNLLIVDEGVLPTPEAQLYSSSEEGSKFKLAEAFVAKTVAQRLIGNFIIKFHKPNRPTKVFREANSALAWLSTL
jgi:hypothetical protein